MPKRSEPAYLKAKAKQLFLMADAAPPEMARQLRQLGRDFFARVVPVDADDVIETAADFVQRNGRAAALRRVKEFEEASVGIGDALSAQVWRDIATAIVVTAKAR